MVICFDVDKETKGKMDSMVAAGQYANYSELIAVAVANQHLMDASAAQSTMPVFPTSGTDAQTEIPKGTSGASPSQDTPGPTVSLALPSLFGPPDEIKVEFLNPAPMPNDVFAVGMKVPADRWVFGQHNKLLPMKASVRALANLLLQSGNGRGIELDKAANEIASAAVHLGDLLRLQDGEQQRQRDDAFSIGFPTSSSRNTEKSKLRYADQFVGSWTSDGRATGLLIDFKFINVDKSKPPKVKLTRPGLVFAFLDNPVLSDPRAAQKFSPEEVDFLVNHISMIVPAEKFAYLATLNAIDAGASTPDELDEVLKQYLSHRDDKPPFSPEFMTTQRAGVISRMADLGLVSRERNGLRVKYLVTPRGFEFIKKGIGK
jgi:hypothetical protein